MKVECAKCGKLVSWTNAYGMHIYRENIEHSIVVYCYGCYKIVKRKR